ncbi:MAG TPA: hypothetical protein VFJ01_11695, partial [Oleiagrimonas sp.]|nr:hypothetical protein [Oleiagrimonas sp.]
FMPHVAPHFRGLTVTCNLYLSRALAREDVVRRFHAAYDDEPLVKVLDTKTPWVSQVAHHHYAEIGGFTLSADGRRVVVVATLDNLLKGAATQAMQNVNRVIGVDELTAIEVARDEGRGASKSELASEPKPCPLATRPSSLATGKKS